MLADIRLGVQGSSSKPPPYLSSHQYLKVSDKPIKFFSGLCGGADPEHLIAFHTWLPAVLGIRVGGLCLGARSY